MNGADALVAAAVSEGIEVCFANPGTTEMPLVLAMDSVPGLRGILCLHENVATGAADGYGRMAGKLAMCLLHLGPGLANGLTNLHNARRAHTPMLNVVGQHAMWALPSDPLLATDVELIARTVSDHVRQTEAPAAVASDLTDAINAAMANGGSIATLIVPHDVQTGDVAGILPVPHARSKATYATGRVLEATKALRSGRSAILLGGVGLSEAGLTLAGRIATATGADLLCDTFFARMERGAGLPAATRLPYFPDQALEVTRRYDHVIVAGSRRPVAFFGYAGLPSFLTTDAQTVVLAGARDDTLGALAALASELHATDVFGPVIGVLPVMPTGRTRCAFRQRRHRAAAAARLHSHGRGVDRWRAILRSVDECARFSHLMLTGGAIGQGPGAATGAAIACPDRKVINFQSDGCGAYSVQAFWTQARENLDVVTIIGSNRSYNILKVELQRAGVTDPGPIARSMAALDHPYLDWVKIAEGFGVPSAAVDTVEALARELERALAQKGPRLIEAVMT